MSQGASITHRDPDGQVVTEQRGNVLLIRIDRPEKRNGFTPKIFAELGAAYSQLERTHDLRVGVLCAAGDHFTAGLDMPRSRRCGVRAGRWCRRTR